MAKSYRIALLIPPERAGVITALLHDADHYGLIQGIGIEIGTNDVIIVDSSPAVIALPSVALVSDADSGYRTIEGGASDFLIWGEVSDPALLRAAIYAVEGRDRERAEAGLRDVTTALAEMRETMAGLRDEIRGALVALAEVQRTVTPDFTV